MTTIHTHVSGYVLKAEHREAAGKRLVELSFKKKHKGKNGAEDDWTWIKASIWEPADWQAPLLIKGAFVSVHGDTKLRSYVAKDGAKAASLEIRADSYGVEVHDPTPRADAPASPAIAHHAEKPYDSQALRSGGSRTPASVGADDEPPFARYVGADA